MDGNVQSFRRVYSLLTVILFLILLGRLAQLQIFSWDRYYRESERNRVRDVVLKPVRGQIFDRNGVVLVDNRPAYSVSVIPYEFLKSDSTVDLLAKILHESPEALKTTIRENKFGNFSPVQVKRDVGFPVLSQIEEYRLDLRGVLWTAESKRYYPAGVKAPHLFGYLGEITSDELQRVDASEYRSGDVIGKNGLEYQYESELRGRSGIQYVEVDVLGREIRNLPELDPKPPETGRNLYLTIDAGVQRYLETAMEGKKGAAVVLDPRDGDVLAILSKPDYDPEMFSSSISKDLWNSLVNHPDRPLYNRAIQSLYPPGSTYKLVVAAAGLESGRIDTSQTVVCRGAYRFGNRYFDCWKKGGHGVVNFLAAIEQSCNVYFFQKGLDVGLENWSHYSKLFHFGELTHIDLPNESAGLVPTKAYFDKKYGVKGWTKGLLLNLSVGQGDLLVTPLQMAYFAMILANAGTAYTPHLIRKQQGVPEPKPRALKIEGISRSTFDLIRKGMYLVVNGAHGTAKAARVPGVDICGKTGTAQNPHGESHAWFIGFAPYDNPEIAFSILVENGGSGGAVAAPIAGGMLRTYFRKGHFAQN